MKRKNETKKQRIDYKWIITVLSVAFILTFILSFGSELIIDKSNTIISIIILIAFILIGILFDIIGVSVTAADEKIYHSMNSRKVNGARVAIHFKKNADKVSSFCCDVIGDICGIVSGSAGVMITTALVSNYNFNLLLTTLTITSIIAALTIGGKAIGKGFAINKANDTLYKFSKVMSLFIRK